MSIINPNELDWLKELKEEDITKELTHDIKLIYDACGLDVLISLWLHFSSIGFYISTAPLTEIKRIYAKRFHNNTNSKQLAIKLGVSERFIYAAQEEKNGSHAEDPELFPKL